jgi:hypothetical protein
MSFDSLLKSTEEEVARLTPDGHPDWPTSLSNLGHSLLSRFQRLGDFSDIDRSISLEEEAVRIAADGCPDKPVFLTHLGN